MKILLDTHSVLWFIEGSSSLSKRAREYIEDEENIVLLSVASLWEMAIKVGLGKLSLSKPYAELIQEQIVQNTITLLDITFVHTVAITTLPMHHRDPFDRLLIVQSIVEQAPLVSIEDKFDQYNIQRIW